MTLQRRMILQLPLVAAFAGPTLAQGTAMTAITATAKKQGKLNLLHNVPPPLGDLWIAEFSKTFPKIEVEANRLGSTEMMQRFGTEYQAGVLEADLLMTLWDETLLKWSDQRWLRTWTPPEAAGLPAKYNVRDQICVVQLNRSCWVSSKTRIKEAACASGASPWQVVCRVTVPLMLFPMLSSLLLCFVLSVEQFAIPALVGIPGHVNTLATELYLLTGSSPPNTGLAAAVGLSMSAVTGLTIFA